jgi:hypothetical protein
MYNMLIGGDQDQPQIRIMPHAYFPNSLQSILFVKASGYILD